MGESMLVNAVNAAKAACGIGFMLFYVGVGIRAYKSRSKDTALQARIESDGDGPLGVVTRKGEGKSVAVEVILVHGVWHGAWFYEPLQAKLAKAGIKSHALQLEKEGDCSLATIAAAIAKTITKICSSGQRVVIVGHSQGGVLVQSVLEDKRQGALGDVDIVGAVLLCTLPLGMFPAFPGFGVGPFRDNFFFGRRGLGFSNGGLFYYYMTGRAPSPRIAAHAMINPETQVLPSGMTRSDYEQRLANADPCGWPTMTHFMPFGWMPSYIERNQATKALILSAEQDIIFPKEDTWDSFRKRFPHATFQEAKGQSHCFCEQGWEDAIVSPIIQFVQKCQ